MNRLVSLVAGMALSLIAVSLLACGGGSGHLESLSISPATAGSPVQFNTVGMFSGSTQTTAVNARWWTSTPGHTHPLRSGLYLATRVSRSALPSPLRGHIPYGLSPR